MTMYFCIYIYILPYMKYVQHLVQNENSVIIYICHFLH